MSENIRYFFPQGCKGIDVLIDNSSRLRSMASSPYIHIRLPVTLKPSTATSNDQLPGMHDEGYNFPGPPHIYAPNQIQMSGSKPPNLYLPPTHPTTIPPMTYLPPVKPQDPTNVYLPPVDKPSSVQPEDPANVYLPPVDKPSPPSPTIDIDILPPPEVQEESCSSSMMCCEEASPGKLIIPIPLKSSSCCARVAKLILPVSGFDEDSIRKLTLSVSQEIDATQLLASILSNLVK